MADTTEIKFDIQSIKKDIENVNTMNSRIDTAIDRLTDLSTSIKSMLAVHEEKIAKQEESIFEAERQIEVRRSDLLIKVDELHSRITTNTKEIMTAAAEQHAQQNKEIQKIRDDIQTRVGVLEKWRYVIIGGSIVAGFMLQKFVTFGT